MKMTTTHEIAVPPPAQLNLDSTSTNHQEEWIETTGRYFMEIIIRETKQKKKAFLLYQDELEFRKIYTSLYDGKETYEETLVLLNEYFETERNPRMQKYEERCDLHYFLEKSGTYEQILMTTLQMRQ